MAHSIKNKILKIADKKIKFKYPIEQVSESDDKYLVCLKWWGENQLPEEYQRNVFLLNKKGEILWQIEAFEMGGAWANVAMGNGYVTAVNTRGFYCEIDIKTGKVISAEFTK